MSSLFSDGDFSFNENVAAVFDDMVCRSVPYYDALISMMVDTIIHCFGAYDNVKIYDFGCSTGNVLRCILDRKDHFSSRVHYVGVDSSAAMLEKLRLIELVSPRFTLDIIHQDLNQVLQFDSMDVCLFNLVLQFLEPHNRLPLLHHCFRKLSKGGLCFFVEKVCFDDDRLQSFYTNQHYAYKQKNGYSKSEIYNKDRSLKNVLVPFTMEQNKQLLFDAGFNVVQPFFQWFNFVGMLALKD